MKTKFYDLTITITTRYNPEQAEEEIRNAIRSSGYDVGSFEVEEFEVED